MLEDYITQGYDQLLNFGGAADATFGYDSGVADSGGSVTGGASSGAVGSSSSDMLDNPTTDETPSTVIRGGDLIDGINFAREGWIKGGAETYDSGVGFFLGWHETTYKFFIGNSSGDKITWDGTTLSITGTLTATTIIGGTFLGGSIHIPDQDTTANSFHVTTDGSGWIGATETNRATAPIQWTAAGIWDVGNTAGTYIRIHGPNGTIGTSTFTAGLQGWQIDKSGNAEFANITARGEFHSQVLSYGEIHATAGTEALAKAAGKLKTDVTTLTSPSTFNVDIEDPDVGHTQVFATGDILRIKDGSGGDNWLTISSVSDQTTFYRYVCTKSFGSNATFRAGAAVVDYGPSGQGIIISTVDGANAPYLSIQTHAGSPWSTVTELVRLGKLNGITDPVFGSLTGYGLWTNNIYLTGGINATTGAIGGFLIGADYIRDVANSFGLASTVTGGDDVRFWAGDTFANRASAPFYVTEAGNLVANSATVKGALTAKSVETAGEAMLQGDVVSYSAADSIKRFRITSLPTTNTSDQGLQLAANIVLQNDPRVSACLYLTPYIRAFHYNGNVTATIVSHLTRYVINPNNGIINSITDSSFVGGVTTPERVDAVAMTTNRVLGVSSVSNNIRARVADLTTAITLGTEVSIDTTNCRYAACEYISDSHVLFIYQDTSTDLIVFAKYTASGTTLTSSSTGTIATLTGTSFVLCGARRFPGTDLFLIAIQNATAGNAQLAIATYNQGSSTFSIGSFVNFPSSGDIAQGGVTFCPLSDTQMLMSYFSTATAITTTLITRSGTVPSFGTLHVTTSADCTPNLTKLNARSALFTWMNGTTATVELLELDSTGTDFVSQTSMATSTIYVSPTDTPTLESGTGSAAFGVNPTRMAFIGFDGADNDPTISTGPYILPYPIGVIEANVAVSGSVSVILSGTTDDVSGLTAATSYFADTGGLVTTDFYGRPAHVLEAKNSTNGIVNVA